MKLNYIIATFNGKVNRSHDHPPPEDVLRCHLEKIFELQTNITQVTIMRAKSDNYYTNYYNIDDIISKARVPIKIIDCENFGYSGGQWLKAVEIFQNQFDYYLFIEDDYCPNMDSFDKILINCHINKFKDGIGLLCSLVEGTENYSRYSGYPIHFEGCIVVNTKTLNMLFDNPRWEGDPRRYIDLIDESVDSSYCWTFHKQKYSGGYYQLALSHIFTLSGVTHEDYLDVFVNGKLLKFPYWDDHQNNIFFYEKGDITRKNYTWEDIFNSPIIPIQLKDVRCINCNTNLPTFPLEIYPHRVCLDIVNSIKDYTQNKIVCDIGCGAGDLLEYLRIKGLCKSVIGVEISAQRYCKNRGYIHHGDILNMSIPDADVYYFWMDASFPYKNILETLHSEKIIIYGDGFDKNQKVFEENEGISLVKKIDFDYDEYKFTMPNKEEEYLAVLKDMRKINPNWTITGRRLVGIYKYTPTLIQPQFPLIIFIVGMHRCGTSVLTSCLVKNGFSIGETVNNDRDIQNPHGYFENDAFTAFHENLLKYNNSAWSNITFDKSTFTTQHVEDYRSLLKQEFGKCNKIIIKDPRLTFFIEFLQIVCNEKYMYKFIFCSRDKEECCTSLAKAQNISISNSEKLYERTHEELQKFKMLKVDYRDTLFKNKDLLEEIANYCDTTITTDSTYLADLNLYRNMRLKKT